MAFIIIIKLFIFMEQTIQNILEQNEEVKWEGKQDVQTVIFSSLVSVVILLLVGFFIRLVLGGGGSEGTCVVNGVARHMEECNSFGNKFSYVIFVIAVLTPIFTYWRYKVTYYLVTTKRLLIKSGFIGADINSIYYDRVHSIFVKVGLLGKIFGTGSVMIDTGKTVIENDKNGHSSKTVYDSFIGVKNPYDVYKVIQEILNVKKTSMYGGKEV